MRIRHCGFYKQNVHPYRLKQRPLEEFQFADLANAAQMIRTWDPKPYVDAYIARRVEDRVRFDAVAVGGAGECGRFLTEILAVAAKFRRAFSV